MGYSYYEIGGKPCGYSVDDVCNQEGCEKEINRGLAYACGGEPGEGSHYCAGYFCDAHMSYVPVPGEPESTTQVCDGCAEAWKQCEACDGSGFDGDGEDCAACAADGRVFDEEHEPAGSAADSKED